MLSSEKSEGFCELKEVSGVFERVQGVFKDVFKEPFWTGGIMYE